MFHGELWHYGAGPADCYQSQSTGQLLYIYFLFFEKGGGYNVSLKVTRINFSEVRQKY